MAEPATKETKHYVLLKADGTDGDNVFTGKQPRQAALKAARRAGGTKDKPIIIHLRERGVHGKTHEFKTWTETVPAPKNKPAWMKKDTLTVGKAEKLGLIDIKQATGAQAEKK